MSNEPRCAKCHRAAAYKVTKIVDGKIHDIFACEEHASLFSPYLQKSGQQQHQLLQWFQILLKKQEQALQAETQDDAEAGALSCPNCGLAFEAYRKTLLLGCSDCYLAFEDHLLNDLRKMHGAVSQNGEGETDLQDELADEAAARPDSGDEDAAESSASDEPPVPKRPPILPLIPDEVRQRLQQAIQREDFTAAAEYRDILCEIEKIQSGEIHCECCGKHVILCRRFDPEGFVRLCALCKHQQPVERLGKPTEPRPDSPERKDPAGTE